jgi:hypothetical protein
MKWHVVPRSPELGCEPVVIQASGDTYESEVDALIRSLLENQDIRRDQQIAWERWWINTEALKGRRGKQGA